MIDDLKIIKKKYGENMSHLCKKLFSTILETEGLLSKIMIDNFNESHDLYIDLLNNNMIEEFKNFIYSKYEKIINKPKKEKDLEKITKTPEELLNFAGYNLVECTTESDIEQFRKYYAIGEELCTFGDKDRLKRCRVFFAVKKNVDEIKRENFKEPKREDEYGTSVISIQFTKDGTNTLSIKNRYNHTVPNPDATYSNNLDNIIEGLTDSFEKYYGIKEIHENEILNIPNYVRTRNGKYYKYNNNVEGTYYCCDNVVIKDYEAKSYDKEKYIIFDHFILDLVNKKIETTAYDTFIDTITNIEKIEVLNNDERKDINITTKDGNVIKIGLDKSNKIISYYNKDIKEIKINFLSFCSSIKKIDLPNVITIGDYFLSSNNSLKEVNLPKVKKVGLNFLYLSKFINKINLPSLKEIETGFLYYTSYDKIKNYNIPMKIKLQFYYDCIKRKHLKININDIIDTFIQGNGRKL